jgi:hypothetical protein
VGCRPLAIALLAGCSFVHGAGETSGPADASTMGPDASKHADAAKSIDGAPDGPPTGSLMVTVQNMGRQNIDLTTEGTTDWAHWGLGGGSGFDRRNGGTAISNIAAPPDVSFSGAPLTASWMNGTPLGATAPTDTGIGVHEGSTMTITVPASTSTQTLRVYLGVQTAGARLDLSLSDSSATTTAQTLTSTNATQNVQYTIVYHAASNGQTLTVSWTDTKDYGNPNQSFAALMSATLY